MAANDEFAQIDISMAHGGEGQAGGRGDALRALQDAPDLRLPHQAGGAHPNHHQELPPARAQIDISTEEKDKLVAEVMRYARTRPPAAPIKREELTQIITKNYRQRALPALVIKEAGDRLATTFGYEMRELQRTRAPSNRAGRSSSQQPSNVEAKSYVLVSKLDPEVYNKYVEDKERAHVSGFAFVVISIVHVAGGKISEEDLWHQLKRLGLNENDENHPLLGNNKQTLLWYFCDMFHLQVQLGLGSPVHIHIHL